MPEQEHLRSGRAALRHDGAQVLLDRLGRGAFGTVWAAYDPQLDRRVAIKVVHARHDGSDAAHARMKEAGLDVSSVRDGHKPGTRVMSVTGDPLGVPTLIIQPVRAEPR